jgi:hypothetical protein
MLPAAVRLGFGHRGLGKSELSRFNPATSELELIRNGRGAAASNRQLHDFPIRPRILATNGGCGELSISPHPH